MPNNTRRSFLGACASVAGLMSLGPQGLSAAARPLSRYAPALLTHQDGTPLSCADLTAEREYIFYYPFRATPCFLIDLGRPVEAAVDLRTRDGADYQWRGGVGPKRSVVAFSAICAHKLTHPSPAVSFIGYRKDPVGFVNGDKQVERRSAVIQCCSEHSIYDPARGAQVVSGPAPQPLAAIALELRDDRLYATGVYGGEMFEPYFEKFEHRLQLEYGGSDPRGPVQDRTSVVAIDRFTSNRIECS